MDPVRRDPVVAPRVLFPIVRPLWVVFAVLRLSTGGFVLLGARVGTGLPIVSLAIRVSP